MLSTIRSKKLIKMSESNIFEPKLGGMKNKVLRMALLVGFFRLFFFGDRMTSWYENKVENQKPYCVT